jgi:hypothetical protein
MIEPDVRKEGFTVEKREYFRKLVRLFEADQADVGMAGAQGQAFAADSGSGADGTALDQPAQKQAVMQNAAAAQAQPQMQPQGLGDANYLSAMPQMQAPDTQSVSEPKKKAKLFDLFRELLNYSSVFVESLTSIDMNLLDMAQIDRVKKNTDQVDDVINKVRSYVVDTFPTDKYEKALYVYILLRTELMTIVAQLRDSLGLNESPEDEKRQKDGLAEPQSSQKP